MGRKGMRGFVKAAAKGGKEDGDEEHAPAAAAGAGASAGASAKPDKKAAADTAVEPQEAVPAGGAEDDPRTETKAQMLQRHKRELLAHKKNLPRLGKKSKEETAALTAALEAQHAREVAELEAREKAAAEAKFAAAEAAAVSKYAAVDTPAQAEAQQRLSKAARRREKAEAREAARTARIEEEREDAGTSARELEEAQLAAVLRPLHLRVREIRADGHCLYRALADQLQQHGSTAVAMQLDYQQLRQLAAKHIRSHPDDFLPYLLADSEDASDKPPAQLVDEYCASLADTAVWGGELELVALAHALRRRVCVHAVGLPARVLGDEYGTDGELVVCFLRHAFGLGEHYNSTEPCQEDEQLAPASSQGQEEGEGAGADGAVPLAAALVESVKI